MPLLDLAFSQCHYDIAGKTDKSRTFACSICGSCGSQWQSFTHEWIVLLYAAQHCLLERWLYTPVCHQASPNPPPLWRCTPSELARAKILDNQLYQHPCQWLQHQFRNKRLLENQKQDWTSAGLLWPTGHREGIGSFVVIRSLKLNKREKKASTNSAAENSCEISWKRHELILRWFCADYANFQTFSQNIAIATSTQPALPPAERNYGQFAHRYCLFSSA